ncbi:APC family permease [Bacillus cereus]|uniref:hypothetical protein n=1 Tax=Bacillus thuringiensis TaxID=1428 RepID=UPI000676E5E3|nr:hypothetical protein [Bacillus thuringiensis]MEB8874742.1 APC family permease [Bacillus cereus]AKR38796.1 Hypothetical protein NF53_p5042 [Bacillus thuringiensis serovar indiana]MBG9643237.1 hypothetical protein [Bacillus thuringiensis]MBG9649329.1 hypothetical protein [Bacillus thuringiensis]MEB9618217.1 APC family permease [Bacillus cereus]
MKSISEKIVLCVGIGFILIGGVRFLGYSISSLVIALISIFAALISISDVLEITRYKKYGNWIQNTALVIIVAIIVFLVYPLNIAPSIISTIGDSFTIIGLGLVILLFGWKEIQEKRSNKEPVESNEMIKNCKFQIVVNEYEQMMKLNDMIEKLKKLDQEANSYNRVHSGWGIFCECLFDYWNQDEGPFFDGYNQQKHYEFICALNNATKAIANTSFFDANYSIKRELQIFNHNFDVTLDPLMKHIELPNIDDLMKEVYNALLLWEELKGLVNRRYEQGRLNYKES